MGKKLIVILLYLVCASCAHKPLPNLPDNWHGKLVGPEALEDKPGVASMQLMIMYGSNICNHTASRYYCPGKGTLFWDPGGGYGREGFVKIDKIRNIVIGNVPTVNDYLWWRTKIPTSATEIFIWEGNNEAICGLYDRIATASKGVVIDGFESSTSGMFCGVATSEFLRDFAKEIMQVDKWGLPHNLSKQLHTQKVDKIFIVDNKTGVIKQYLQE